MVDGAGDSVGSAALLEFFSGLSVSASDFIFFEVTGSSSSDGAWCAENAAWYIDNYRALSSGSTAIQSGSWNKWTRPESGAWSGPGTGGYTNYFGSNCDGNPYSWCSEWGLAGRHLGVMPGNASNGESYASGWSGNAGWQLTIRIGSNFEAACNGITGPSCFDGQQNQDETGVDCGGVCGACPTCGDGIQNQDETGVDCGGVCGACAVAASNSFTFVDSAGDNVSGTALRDFFSALSVSTSDFIFFELSGPSGSDGAWCAERADWYASNYVSSAGGNTNIASGNWNKWARSEGGAWSSPVTTGYTNYFGTGCDGNAWSWCSEWGLAGRNLGFMPNNDGSGETRVAGSTATARD